MGEIARNLEDIRSRIADACRRSGRSPETARLIAVSKTFPAELIRGAVEAGQRSFGESRLQEAEPKIEFLPGDLDWHFIGRVQRNKVRRLMKWFGTIHGIDSLRLATYADEVASEAGVFPRVFLQVNLANEDSKGGFAVEELRSQMESLLRLERLEILGLMTIPPASEAAADSRRWFAGLRELRDSLEGGFGVRLPGLSMGMSGDFEVAVEEGATHVRVGSAIFGTRSYRVDGELG